MENEKELKRELKLVDLIFLGLGCIVGAGVFVILGKTIFFGGKNVLFGFLLVTIISVIMGYVYIEIYSRYKSGITEYLAVKDTIGESVGKITLYVVYLFAIFTSMTIIVCITKYIGLYKKDCVKEIIFSVMILTIITALNLSGIKTSKIVCNMIGISMVILFLGISMIGLNKINIGRILGGPKPSWNSFLLSTILALFLFNGYDVIIKMSPEAKDENDTKKAVIWSIGITAFFYFMIILVLISILGYNSLGSTYHPLGRLYELLVSKNARVIVYFIGIIILFNTAFLTLIGSTRFLYGLAKDKQIPYYEHLTVLNKNNVPQNTILLTLGICILCALINNEVILTVITNFSVMYILIVISIALLLIRWRERDDKEKQLEHNYIFGNVGNIPIPVVLCLGTMFYLMVIILKNKFWIGK